MPHSGLPDSSTAEAEYANGRLWVQGPDEMELLGYIDVPEQEKTNYASRFQMTPAERKSIEEGATHLETANQWGFYDDPEEVDMLIGWLDPTRRARTEAQKGADSSEGRHCQTHGEAEGLSCATRAVGRAIHRQDVHENEKRTSVKLAIVV